MGEKLIMLSFLAYWLACGLLAVGMCRHSYAKMNSPTKEDGPSLLFCGILLIMGSLSLCVAFLFCTKKDTWGLRYVYDKTEDKVNWDCD